MHPFSHLPGLRRTTCGAGVGFALFCVVLVTLTGCKISGPEHKTDPRFTESFTVNTEQVRLLTRSKVDPLCGLVEEAADTILAEATDPVVRREALLWKIEAVPALREALYQPNPYTAFADAWVLSYQMIDYFESGQGNTALGSAAPIAVTASRRLANEMKGVAAACMNPETMEQVEVAIQEWASANPITHSIAARETTLSRAVERGDKGVFTAPQVVGSLDITFDDLNRRVEVYSDQLLRQSRWEAELFAMDMTAQYEVEETLPALQEALRSLERVAVAMEDTLPAVERSLAVVESAPELISEERAAAFEEIQSDLLETLTFLEEERATLVGNLQSVVGEEREILVAAIDQTAIRIVDHAFHRSLQLVGLVLAVLGFAWVVTLIVMRRTLRPRG